MADSTIEEIKRRVDVVDLISQTVQLKRAGRSFKGLCPFHGEKTPSFTVSPERGTWHCFGCSEGGDIFTFLQKRDNLDFPEALRVLADRAGVELERGGPARPDPAEREKRDRGHQILESAALFYRGALLGPQGAATRAYLAERGVSDETAERFGLGYAEPTGRALERHLTQAGYTRDEAVAAGALGQSDDGRTYDRFRERLIFPIRDADGRMIGFGGRALKPDQQPKYLNSPQSELFDKGANLYALDQARDQIRQAGRAIVVEGYMDALVPHQHGFRNVVATLGTAITERHIQVLRRMSARQIVLSLDPDAAGVKAAMRGSGVALDATADEAPAIPFEGRLRRSLPRFYLSRGTQLRVMTLPEGKDPDEVVRENPEVWRAAVDNALLIPDFVLQNLPVRYDLDASEDRQEAVREVMDVIQDWPDPIDRDRYIQRLARVLNVREETLLQMAQTRPRRVAAPTEADAAPPMPSRGTPEERLQELVLALLLRAPEAGAGLEAGDFESAAHLAMFERLVRGGPWPDPAAALDRLAALGSAFEREVGRLRALDEENARLMPDDVARELRVRALELRKQRHLRHYQALNIALREETDLLSAAEQREYRERLAQVATLLGAVFAEQQQLGVVGTTSWSVRRGQEVLGG